MTVCSLKTLTASASAAGKYYYRLRVGIWLQTFALGIIGACAFIEQKAEDNFRTN